MPINEHGEFVRTEVGPERPNWIAALISKRDGLLTQSAHPDNLKQPSGVLYWVGPRLEHNIQVFRDMKALAAQHGSTTIVSPYDGKVIDLPEFFEMIQRSIDYSKKTS